jgi:hypothetical protein
MNILQNSDDYVAFLIKHKLSTNQFLLLHLLNSESMFKSNDKLRFKTIGNIYKWSAAAKTLKGAGWSETEIQDLIDKEYLWGMKSVQKIDGKDVLTYSIDQLILTQKFSDIMFINASFAFDEILEIYPDTMDIQGQTVFTKSGDLDKLREKYVKLIKNSIIKHEEIKAIIQFGVDKGLCKYKLDNFLNEAIINSIRKLMEESYGTGTDI